MKIKSLIASVVLAPSLVLAQANLPSGVSSTGKPAGMPSVPTPQTVQNTAKAVETVSGATSITPNNPLAPTEVKSSEKSTSKKSDGSSMKSTYDWCGKDGKSIC